MIHPKIKSPKYIDLAFANQLLLVEATSGIHSRIRDLREFDELLPMAIVHETSQKHRNS